MLHASIYSTSNTQYNYALIYVQKCQLGGVNSKALRSKLEESNSYRLAQSSTCLSPVFSVPCSCCKTWPISTFFRKQSSRLSVRAYLWHAVQLLRLVLRSSNWSTTVAKEVAGHLRPAGLFSGQTEIILFAYSTSLPTWQVFKDYANVKLGKGIAAH